MFKAREDVISSLKSNLLPTKNLMSNSTPYATSDKTSDTAPDTTSR